MDTVETSPSRVALIGVPLEIGASQRGTLMGPAALRTAGLLTVLTALGLEVTDHGDIGIADVAELQDLRQAGARLIDELAAEVLHHADAVLRRVRRDVDGFR